MKRLVSPFELKLLDPSSSADGKTEMLFSGYGAVFGNIDAGGDIIEKGAFAENIQQFKDSGRWPAMLLQHGGTADYHMPPGVWTDIYEDDNGLFVEGKLAATQRGQDTYALLKMQPRPAISGLSIGYRTLEESYETQGKKSVRHLKKIELFEISLVTFPMNDAARIASVKAAEQITTIREFENFLRDAGFSGREAKAIAARGFAQKTPRDVDEGDEELVSALKALKNTINPQ